MFAAPHLDRLQEIARHVFANAETGLAEFNAQADHGHLLVGLPPKVAVSLVNSLKGVSSRQVRQEFPDLT